jgi:general secretion pathway protein F/type IV pilus assembly protein PilC
MLPLTIYVMGKHHKTRYIRDLVVIKLPIIKVIALNKLLATFSEQFRMLISAGISIGRLFDLMIPALGNEYFRVHLHKAKVNILNGSPIAESLEQQKIFPAMIISKIRIGQTSGTLEAQFDFLSKYYTRKLDNATDNLGKLIEPLLIIVIGGMFAIIIMGLLLPIYDLVSKVGKG